MVKILFILLICFSFTVSAQEKDYELPYDSSILCEEEQTTGFNWKNNSWRKVTFKKERIIIKKIDIFETNVPVKILRFCRNAYNNDFESGGSSILKRCYSFNSLGEEPRGISCDEYYSGKEKNLRNIQCRQDFIDDGGTLKSKIELMFNPYGEFSYSTPIGFTDGPNEKSEYKNNFKISVGKCSMF